MGFVKPLNNMVPRSSILPFNVPSEIAIRKAIYEIEKLEANENLTSAISLLDSALKLVSNYVDNELTNHF